MNLLFYENLEINKVKKQYDKVIDFLKKGDFKSADVKKMVSTGYYRAKLDDTNRLLFKFGMYQGEKYIFVLEVILNHAYEKSRFLNGIAIDEQKLTLLKDERSIAVEDFTPIHYINPKKSTFCLLDKILSFDDIQENVLKRPFPTIIIGSAGSGKTALTLQKLKQLSGKVLYTTLSPYLVENASNLYSAYEYENKKQEVEFLSFHEFLSTIEIPNGKEVDFTTFDNWCFRYKQSHKIKDTYKIFEEFKGVLTGSVIDKPYLSKKEYLALGIKQSIFSAEEREKIYDLFEKYAAWMSESGLYDSNIVSFQLLDKVQPQFDYVVIDEVQDITNIQLMIIIKSLFIPTQFLLCGDSNQIVHPNFFSWANIKTMFYHQEVRTDIITILATNYRNTPQVTKIANQLLLIKNARFGSIDKESTYLVQSNAKHEGNVEFLEDTQKNKTDINQKTNRSTQYAVLVLRNEDKHEARNFFKTPLLFSIHEAKGLEYENIILYNAISGYDREFRELANGVLPEDLLEENLKFARAKNKSDKSLDEYKFYVNSLYVGITRAITNLYVIEKNKNHELLALLGLTDFKQQTSLKNQASTDEDWQREALKLEMQGKKEQAEAIRNQILQIQEVPWEVITKQKIEELSKKALDAENFNKKAKDSLFNFALFYNDKTTLNDLSKLKYRPADNWQKDQNNILKRNYAEYQLDNIKQLQPKLQKYGVDYKNEQGLAAIMLAMRFDSKNIAAYLLKNGASLNTYDVFGKNPLQFLLSICFNDIVKGAQKINHFYPILKNESLKIKIENKLVKIDCHQAEFFMLNFMIATMDIHMAEQISTPFSWEYRKRPVPCYETQNFIDFFEGLSNHVVPDYRKVRSYISSILSKNEVDRDDKYSKKLFLRIKQGYYLPNPKMEILQNDQWINFYDHVGMDRIAYLLESDTDFFGNNNHILEVIVDYKNS